MTNAELTEILALTDALLEAGWRRGSEDGGWVGDYPAAVFPTEHCLVGALRVALEEVQPVPLGAISDRRNRLYEWVATFLPAPYQTTAGNRTELVDFNDRSRKVTRLRDLIQRAARSLTK